MPIYKRKSYKGRFQSPRVSKKRKYTPRQATKVAVTTTTNYGVNEIKHFDGSGAALGAIQTGTFNILNQIAQGTSDNQRIGDKIFVKKLLLRLRVHNNPSGSDSAAVRIIVFKWLDNTAPSISDLLPSVISTATLASPLTWDTMSKRVVYMDEIFQMSAQSNCPSFNKYLTKTIRWTDPLKVTYSSVTTTPYTASLYCVVLSDQSTNYPTYELNSRIQYIG